MKHSLKFVVYDNFVVIAKLASHLASPYHSRAIVQEYRRRNSSENTPEILYAPKHEVPNRWCKIMQLVPNDQNNSVALLISQKLLHYKKAMIEVFKYLSFLT